MPKNKANYPVVSDPSKKKSRRATNEELAERLALRNDLYIDYSRPRGWPYLDMNIDGFDYMGILED